MYRKITALALAIVLSVVTTACGKGETKTKVPLKKQGFRIYASEMKQGIVSGERKLRREYEDLGTEQTDTQYDDDGAVTEINKCYYDDTGELLLKQVIWEKSSPTKSYEYDRNGHIIRESSKIENPEEEPLRGLYLPIGVFQFSGKKYLYVDFPSSSSSDVTELKTEYTYFGDSSRVKSVKTITDDGTVVASFEMGEGDIVISGFLTNGDEQYEETYDPVTGTGTWKYMIYGVVDESGVKTYDSAGRCVSCTAYSDTWKYLVKETSVTFDEEGTHAVTKYYDSDSEEGNLLSHMTELLYDKDERETYLLDMLYDEDGSVSYGERRYITYYGNGEEETVSIERWDDETQKMEMDYEITYDDAGEVIDSYMYGSFGIPGKLSSEKHVRIVDDPAVAGKVKCETTTYYVDKAGGLKYDTLTVEQYDVCMTNEYGKDEWYQYLEVRTRDGDRTEYLTGTFDSDGHLVETENEYSNTIEFDQQGRIFREKYDNNWEGSIVTLEYEYWEIDPENQ